MKESDKQQKLKPVNSQCPPEEQGRPKADDSEKGKDGYSEKEQAIIEQRLRDLGYL